MVRLVDKRAAVVGIQAGVRGYLARRAASVMRAQAAAEVEAARRRSVLEFCDVSTGLRGQRGSRRELSIKQRAMGHRHQLQQPTVKGVRVMSAGARTT